MVEETLVIIKPDGMERGLAPDIISRILSVGLKVADQKDLRITSEQAEQLYREHKEKPFYSGVVDYMMSGEVRVLRVKGESAVSKMRELMGATDPKKAAPGTIRADFRQDHPESKIIINTIHGSDSTKSAEREIAIFFN